MKHPKKSNPSSSNSPQGVSRGSFLKTAGFLPLAVYGSGAAAASPQSEASSSQVLNESETSLRNQAFDLSLSVAKQGLRAKLTHSQSETVLADGNYSYSFGDPQFDEVRVEERGQDRVVRLEGVSAGVIGVRHEFRVPSDSPWIEEQITLTNHGSQTLFLPDARCGFVLPVKLSNGEVTGPLKDFQFTAVPFRREPTGNRQQYADYSVLDVLTKRRWSNLRSKMQTNRWGDIVAPISYSTGFIQESYSQYASEGWIFRNGERGFLFSKYSQTGMEWVLLDRLPLDENTIGLRWGGFGIYENDPEPGARLAPGASHQFGVSRVTAYSGGLTKGFYTFRDEMEARGHGCPDGFDPPVHWNEIYDNKLWWLPNAGQDDPENRAKYYRREDMEEEAAKARHMGCEALYLDPGWDTSFASKIWDANRLGDMKSFVSMLREKYGLSLSLHCPLSGWCNPTSYSRKIDRTGPGGKRIEMSLCGASTLYVEATFNRFDKLAREGATYFMFDGTMFNGECWDPNHGHAVPSTREEHVQATNRLARMVHEVHPEVLIEMHDQMLGGTILRYVPTYYGHGMPPQDLSGPGKHGYDCIWAYELMWDPMTDLVGGHSIALYYYNLAYSLPLYIHIDLRKDNEHALMLWWNMSTCRYLGIGGTHNDIRVREKQKEAMETYRRLKPVFTAGKFYGMDELTHLHVHPEKRDAVINCFNLDEKTTTRELRFDPGNYGMDPRLSYRLEGGEVSRQENTYAVSVEIPGYGHTLLEIHGS